MNTLTVDGLTFHLYGYITADPSRLRGARRAVLAARGENVNSDDLDIATESLKRFVRWLCVPVAGLTRKNVLEFGDDDLKFLAAVASQLHGIEYGELLELIVREVDPAVEMVAVDAD
jgi:hypothetical protein